MKELYAEGIASHGGPAPCGGDREGVVEALASGTCRQAIEPRNNTRPGRRRRCVKRKATLLAAIARAAGGPRGVEEPCMHGTFMRENREIQSSPVVHGRGRRGRSGKAEAASLRCTRTGSQTAP